jgi:hypothetical protein
VTRRLVTSQFVAAHRCRGRFVIEGAERVTYMNPYLVFGSRGSTPEATWVADLMSAWHDAMVVHERRLRDPRSSDTCSEECPHAEAEGLWTEALEVFGDRARDLTFLRKYADRFGERGALKRRPRCGDEHRWPGERPAKCVHEVVSRVLESDSFVVVIDKKHTAAYGSRVLGLAARSAGGRHRFRSSEH